MIISAKKQEIVGVIMLTFSSTFHILILEVRQKIKKLPKLQSG